MSGCSCSAWKVNLPKIEGPIVLQALRSSTQGYDGAPFRFCPWCGTPLSLAAAPIPEAEDDPPQTLADA